jgi:NAD(P)-dependent dehydrogenase (short-subunit alcohol dehydrogenase family)
VLNNLGGGAPPPGLVVRAKENLPIQRLTEVQDIANAVLFPASDVSRNIAGQTIGVNGGRGMI